MLGSRKNNWTKLICYSINIYATVEARKLSTSVLVVSYVFNTDEMFRHLAYKLHRGAPNISDTAAEKRVLPLKRGKSLLKELCFQIPHSSLAKLLDLSATLCMFCYREKNNISKKQANFNLLFKMASCVCKTKFLVQVLGLVIKIFLQNK